MSRHAKSTKLTRSTLNMTDKHLHVQDWTEEAQMRENHRINKLNRKVTKNKKKIHSSTSVSGELDRNNGQRHDAGSKHSVNQLQRASSVAGHSVVNPNRSVSETGKENASRTDNMNNASVQRKDTMMYRNSDKHRYNVSRGLEETNFNFHNDSMQRENSSRQRISYDERNQRVARGNHGSAAGTNAGEVYINDEELQDGEDEYDDDDDDDEDDDDDDDEDNDREGGNAYKHDHCIDPNGGEYEEPIRRSRAHDCDLVVEANVPVAEIGLKEKSSIAETELSTLHNSYASHCKNVRLSDTPEDIASQIRQVTKRVGWKFFKMLDEDDYLVTSDFAKCMMQHLGYNVNSMEPHEQASKWSADLGHIRAAYQSSRSSVTQALKKSWLEQLKKGEAYSLEEFMEGRSNTLAYIVFCEKYVQCVTGSNWFKHNFMVRSLTDYIGASDEALTFLILANNWMKWTEIAKDPLINGVPKTKKQWISNQKYFVEGQGRGKSWSVEGREFYNQMHDFVTLDRKQNGKLFDNAFLSHMNGEKQSESERRKNKRLAKQSNVGETRKVRCKHDYVTVSSNDSEVTGNNKQSVRNPSIDENGDVINTVLV